MWKGLVVTVAILCGALANVLAQRETYRFHEWKEAPMATEHRHVGTTGDWGAAASWTGGHVPGRTPDADATVSAIFDSGSQSMTLNLDRLTAGDLRLVRIVTTPDYSGDIGASGNPLEHELASSSNGLSRIIHRGTGSFYFQGNTGGFSDVLVDSTNYTNAFTGGGAGDGLIRNLFVKSGRVTIQSTCYLTGGYVIVDGPKAYLVIEGPQSNRPKYIVVLSGTCENKREVAAGAFLIVLGGQLIQTGRVADAAMIIVGPDGRFTYTPSDTIGAAYNPDIVVAGLVDMSNNWQNVQFADLIRTQLAGISGTVVQSGDPGPNATDIDLREEYP